MLGGGSGEGVGGDDGFAGDDGLHAYFVHSYHLVPEEAGDLVAATRIAGELERIGDYAADSAGIVLQMDGSDMYAAGLAEVLEVSGLCQQMLDEVLAAYLQKDAARARQAASRRFFAPVASATAPSSGAAIATSNRARPVTRPQRAVAAAGARPSFSAMVRKKGG